MIGSVFAGTIECSGAAPNKLCDYVAGKMFGYTGGNIGVLGTGIVRTAVPRMTFLGNDSASPSFFKTGNGVDSRGGPVLRFNFEFVRSFRIVP